MSLIKLFFLITLSALVIVLSLIGTADLNVIYTTTGAWLGFEWLTSGQYAVLISNIGHGVVFFGLMITIGSVSGERNLDNICRTKVRPTVRPLRWRILWQALGLMVFAVCVEATQWFTETRQATWQDLAYSLLGIVLAMVVIVVWHRLFDYSLGRKQEE